MRLILLAALIAASPAAGFDFAGASLARWQAGADAPDAYYDVAMDPEMLSLDYDDGEPGSDQRPATAEDRADLLAMIDSQLKGLSTTEGLAPAGEKVTLALDYVAADVTFTVTRTFAREAVPVEVSDYFCAVYDNKVLGLTCPP